MRIGISGAAGTGKSTLAAALAQHLGVPLVEDPTEEALRERGFSAWRGVRDPRARREVRLRALNVKMRREKELTDCVSDKTVVDFLAYWLLNQAPVEGGAQNFAVLDLVRDHLPAYDRIIVLPWRASIEAGEGRNTDPIHQLKIQACIEGLCCVLGAPIVRAEYTLGEDMAGFVERALAIPR